MTDSNKLKEIIRESGVKKCKIIEVLDISYQTLQRKINNITPFTAEEINLLCELLEIKSLKVKEAVFFAKKSGKYSHIEVEWCRKMKIIVNISQGNKKLQEKAVIDFIKAVQQEKQKKVLPVNSTKWK